MTNTYARCIRIDLDDEEMPAMLTIVMTDDVLERVRRDFDLDAARRVDRLMEAHLYMARAADIARHYGRTVATTDPGVALYDCVGKVAARFWDCGLHEAPGAELVAKNAEATR